MGWLGRASAPQWRKHCGVQQCQRSTFHVTKFHTIRDRSVDRHHVGLAKPRCGCDLNGPKPPQCWVEELGPRFDAERPAFRRESAWGWLTALARSPSRLLRVDAALLESP